MAHRGHFYKLHFRRDLCIGCRNYRGALPDAWITGGFIQRWIPTGPLENIANHIVPGHPNHRKEAWWLQFPLMQVFGHSMYLEVTFARYDTNRQRTILRVGWNHQLKERGWQEVESVENSTCSRMITFDSTNALRDIDKNFWNAIEVRCNLELRYADWTQYP